MKKAICKLESVSGSPITFGKYYSTPKLPKELANDYEKRTWRERLHYREDGAVYIPAAMFGNCIREAAKFRSIPIPGMGKANFTKHFDAGIQVMNDIDLKVQKDDVEGVDLMVPSDGRRGGTSRVAKTFPIIDSWNGEISVLLMDDIITKDVFEDVLRTAGQLIGIGTFRPRNRGTNGRFAVSKINWTEVQL